MRSTSRSWCRRRRRFRRTVAFEQLREWQIDISARQLSALITDRHRKFPREKDALLQAWLQRSRYVLVDDTGARHQGKNGYCRALAIARRFVKLRSSRGVSLDNALADEVAEVLMRIEQRAKAADDDSACWGERQGLYHRYGNVSAASIGAILRGLLNLGEQGGEVFFGEPMLDIAELMQTDDGKGVVNILAGDKLMASPRLYSTFLLWLLSQLFEQLPEVGDLDRPKLVSFLDEQGRPKVVERALILPPASRIGPQTAQERQAVIKASAIYGHYEKLVDRESAYEKLKGNPTTPPGGASTRWRGGAEGFRRWLAGRPG